MSLRFETAHFHRFQTGSTSRSPSRLSGWTPLGSKINTDEKMVALFRMQPHHTQGYYEISFFKYLQSF